MKRLMFSVIVLILLGFSLLANADVSLPAIIGDNMVLQKSAEVPIWGKADAGEKVTVSIGDQRAVTTADSNGKWMVKLSLLEAGGSFDVNIVGNNTITLSNVLVGEVWVCSGQSNMQWAVKSSLNAEQEIAEAKYPKLRLFSVKRVVADEPLKDTEGSWVECSPETIEWFSAAGYFFGRKLHQELDVPVGLIHTSWGGTPAESWTSKPTLESDLQLKPILNRWANLMEKYPEAKKQYDERLAQWEKDAQKAKEAGEKEPAKPWAPVGPDHPNKPAGLYNGMIAPVVPYGIAGAIWYQGESNAGRAYEYRKLFPAMIADWRRNWGQGDFTFLFVQLANFMKIDPQPVECAWAELREAQLMTLMLPETGMAVTIDIGEANNIHPKNKQDVGNRLALAALAETYGLDVPYSGPIYDSMMVQDNKIRLSFKYANEGLTAKDGELKGFAIADQDMKFVWAKAVIDGSEVVVWSPKISRPVAVRYGWANNPQCNLYNTFGLPASPFRTDSLPGITAGK